MSRRNARQAAVKGALSAADRPLARGWTIKVHALTDVIGRPCALLLTPGNVADVKAAPELLARMGRSSRKPKGLPRP